MMTEADLPEGGWGWRRGYVSVITILLHQMGLCVNVRVCKRVSFCGSVLGFSCVCHPKRSSPKDRPQPQHLSKLQ